MKNRAKSQPNTRMAPPAIRVTTLIFFFGSHSSLRRLRDRPCPNIIVRLLLDCLSKERSNPSPANGSGTEIAKGLRKTILSWKPSIKMVFKTPEPGESGDELTDAIQANRIGIRRDRILIVSCVLLGPLGMAYLDWKHSFLGLIASFTFLVALYLAWPALMPAFLVVGFLMTAFHAHGWIHGQAAQYQDLFDSGFKSLFDSLPFFLPLVFDFALLVLLESMLRQAWLNKQRGSMLAALLVACVSTPTLLIGVRALGRPLIRRTLRPFQAERGSLESNS
jgi:hypothetical protein